MDSRLIVFAGVMIAVAGPAMAHPGGLDASGCHTNRKTGERHCHRAQGSGGGGGGGGSGSQPAIKGSGSREVFYPNCAAARAAGAAPLRRGEPGYRPAMDRDGDGVACE